LKPGGQAVILEFSMPEKFPVKQLYRFYFKHLLPSIGRLISKDKSAYSYLPESVEKFPKPNVFSDILASFGIDQCSIRRLSWGIATLYISKKE
jgi:demethylmenaquinone methyltransferase/2-methoxy-6-polyprenyl-1,4-benzoquinol methylase